MYVDLPFKSRRQWFSGKIHRCHRWAPRSIRGWRKDSKVFLFIFLIIVFDVFFILFCFFHFSPASKSFSASLSVPRMGSCPRDRWGIGK